MKAADWSLVTFIPAGSTTTQAGVRLQDGSVVVPPAIAFASGVMDLMEDWSEHEAELRNLDPSALERVAVDRIVAPLLYPRKAICAGANFKAHVKEMMKIDGLHPSYAPFFFLKPPTTAIVGDRENVEIDADPAARVDWEAELSVVISKSGKNIPVDQAGEHIAGYLVSNDISHRGWFFRDEPPSPAFKFDWMSHKAVDTSLPIGPGMVPAWLVPDTSDLAIKLWVNGELKQDSSTSDMIFSVHELIAAASKVMTLEPGDIIATGTPGGVGVARQEFLKAGDTVAIEIDGVGRLENPIVAAG